MRLDRKTVDRLYRILSNEKCRDIIKLIDEDGAKRFSEIAIHMGYTDPKTRREHTNLVSHYLSSLKKSFILRHDRLTNTYYLTRMGVRILKLIKKFEEFYFEYDMNDVKQDGFVENVAIVRMRTE